MKTLNFIKRKHRGTGRTQPDPKKMVGGKVWAPLRGMTEVCPCSIRNKWSPKVCHGSQTCIPHGFWQCLISTTGHRTAEKQLLTEARREQPGCGARLLHGVGGLPEEKEFKMTNTKLSLKMKTY